MADLEMEAEIPVVNNASVLSGFLSGGMTPARKKPVSIKPAPLVSDPVEPVAVAAPATTRVVETIADPVDSALVQQLSEPADLSHQDIDLTSDEDREAEELVNARLERIRRESSVIAGVKAAEEAVVAAHRRKNEAEKREEKARELLLASQQEAAKVKLDQIRMASGNDQEANKVMAERVRLADEALTEAVRREARMQILREREEKLLIEAASQLEAAQKALADLQAAPVATAAPEPVVVEPEAEEVTDIQVEEEAVQASPVEENTGSAADMAQVLGEKPIHETQTDRKANGLAMLAKSNACMMESGDAPDDVPEVRTPGVTAYDDRLARLGIPTRPRQWPIMMRWPSEAALDHLERQGITDETRRKEIAAIMASLEAAQVKMLDRARRIDEYIRQTHTRDPSRTSRQKIGDSLRLLRKDEDTWRKRDLREVDPYYGIRFALLLDEKTSASTRKLVRSWGHEVAETVSGGVVRATDNAISFGVANMKHMDGYQQGRAQIPMDAIKLGIMEGQARGWKTFRVQGTKDFAMNFAKVANELGVHAEITYSNSTLFPFPKRRMVVGARLPSDPVKDQDQNKPDAGQELSGRGVSRIPNMNLDPGASKTEFKDVKRRKNDRSVDQALGLDDAPVPN